jgi:hypothetical protein
MLWVLQLAAQGFDRYGVPHLLAQLSYPDIDPLDFWGGMAISDHQGSAQGCLQGQVLLEVVGGGWEDPEQREPFGQVADRLDTRRTFEGSLTRPLPIGDGLGDETGLRVVMGESFGLGLTRLRISCLEDLRNWAMGLVPHVRWYRLIGHFLS